MSHGQVHKPELEKRTTPSIMFRNPCKTATVLGEDDNKRHTIDNCASVS